MVIKYLVKVFWVFEYKGISFIHLYYKSSIKRTSN